MEKGEEEGQGSRSIALERVNLEYETWNKNSLFTLVYINY